MSGKQATAPRHIVVLHMDLGIGGAEMLMVTLACSLQSLGHSVTVLTTHHDTVTGHCFEETKLPNGALAKHIKVYGAWIPRTLGGKGTAICAIVRMLYLSLCAMLFHGSNTDLYFLDGVSAPIPLLRLADTPIMFYCHFPDKLLCTDRGGLLKRGYRMVIDFLEELSTGCADLILVNSKFTGEIFRTSFPFIASFHTPKVLYPTINETAAKQADAAFAVESSKLHADADILDGSTVAEYTADFDYVFVSLNRYERKKNIGLAIEALVSLMGTLKCKQLAEMHNQTASNSNNNNNSDDEFVIVDNDSESKQLGDIQINKIKEPTRVLLVIAGGYDSRVDENKEHLIELMSLCDRLGVSYRHKSLHNISVASDASATSKSTVSQSHSHISEAFVEFRTSISSVERLALMKRATALLYTPDKEHFGIVPLEAMRAGCPVIAVNSGGPLETVVHERTGFLCPQTKEAFADAMRAFIDSAESKSDILPPLRDRMSAAGIAHVQRNFTSHSSDPQLSEYIESVITGSTGNWARFCTRVVVGFTLGVSVMLFWKWMSWK